MSKEDKLLKRLKSDKTYIPFNEDYNFKEILKYIDENKDSFDIKNQEKALYSIYFNQYFVFFRDLLTNTFEKNEISKKSAIDIIITASNRDYYLSREKFSDKLSSLNEIFYDQLLNARFDSHIDEYGSINLQAGLEASNDGVNSILNQLKYISFGNKSIDFESIDNLFKLLAFANTYVIIKACYDTAIWENYSIKKEKNPDKIYIRSDDDEIVKLNKIGFFRLQRNLIAYKAIIYDMQFKSPFYNIISDNIKNKKKNKRLKKVYIENHELKFKIGDGEDKKAILNEMLVFSELTAYYSFIKDEFLPNFQNINLFDLLTIYAELKLFFSKITEIKIDETEANKENFDKYRFFIRLQVIKEYLYHKTKYAPKQISQIIHLFIHENGNFNIWERPLIKIDNEIYPMLYPFLHGNLFRFIDYWLEIGGFNLDQRGKLFEKYIKTELKKGIEKKSFFVKIIEQNTFKNILGNSEEIDLIIEFKEVTIIAEVKCIKFPVDTRDFANVNKRLNNASIQINRKVDFLLKNKKEFEGKYSFLEKKIVKLVVTNFPEFSGAKFNSVSVTDFSLMENYLTNGKFEEGVAFFKNSNSQNLHYKKTVYYNNESEYCKNLESFFTSPIPIYQQINNVDKRKQLVSFPSAEPSIFMDYFDFKDNITI